MSDSTNSNDKCESNYSLLKRIVFKIGCATALCTTLHFASRFFAKVYLPKIAAKPKDLLYFSELLVNYKIYLLFIVFFYFHKEQC
jgi:hypothetical protein